MLALHQLTYFQDQNLPKSATPAIPPTTPPAMAPLFVEEPLPLFALSATQILVSLQSNIILCQ